MCDEIGVYYNYHDSREKGWLLEQELFGYMRASDAIVLYYNEVCGIIGASSALRTALASHRPVIVNDVSWFDDTWDIPGVYHVRNEKELKETLKKVLHVDYIAENSYRKIAEYLLKIYGG